MPVLRGTDLNVFPICLGGNVFGWTADERESFAVLDAYVEAGGNFIDTADVYTEWIPGNRGGESEQIIGRWMRIRGNRDSVVLATKVGMFSEKKGLSPDTIRTGLDSSLTRLETDCVDLYYAHEDDPDTPLEETMCAFDELIRAGKIRYAAASNYTASRLAAALAASDREHLPRYAAVQPHYNLVERTMYEPELADLCAREGLPCLPYRALANGFLTGKYRSPDGDGSSPRAAEARALLDDRGIAALRSLDRIAATHDTTAAAVAVAWLLARPAVASAIASTRNPRQLAEVLPGAWLNLSEEELHLLTTTTDT
jgi:aryl-alcohol dehydrogenase (NADP+)